MDFPLEKSVSEQISDENIKSPRRDFHEERDSLRIE